MEPLQNKVRTATQKNCPVGLVGLVGLKPLES